MPMLQNVDNEQCKIVNLTLLNVVFSMIVKLRPFGCLSCRTGRSDSDTASVQSIRNPLTRAITSASKYDYRCKITFLRFFYFLRFVFIERFFYFLVDIFLNSSIL